MNQAYNEQTILDYLEGDLADSDRARFEQTLKGDARLATLVGRLSEDRAALRALPREQPESLMDAVRERLERTMLLDDREPVPPPFAVNPDRALFRIDHFLAWSAVAAMFIVTATLMVMSLYDPVSLELAHLSEDSAAPRGEDIEAAKLGDALAMMPQANQTLDEAAPAPMALKPAMRSMSEPAPAMSLEKQDQAPSAAPPTPLAMRGASPERDAAAGVTIYPGMTPSPPEPVEIDRVVDDAAPTHLPAAATAAPDAVTTLIDGDIDIETRLSIIGREQSLSEVDRILQSLGSAWLGTQAAADTAVESAALPVGPARLTETPPEPPPKAEKADPALVLRVAAEDQGAVAAAVGAWARERDILWREVPDIGRKTETAGATLADRATAAPVDAATKPVVLELSITAAELAALKERLTRTSGTSAVVASVEGAKTSIEAEAASRGRESATTDARSEASTEWEGRRTVRVRITRHRP